MKQLLTLLIFVIVCTGFAQVPSLDIVSRRSFKPVELRELDVEVEVVGNIATTTYDMTFYNPNHSELAGIFSMPLTEGQEICRYAMETRGELREGVVVEKVKARQTYEAEVKRGKNPGIVSKTKGNFFKTKVYPIPKRDTKRIVFAISQTLDGDADNYFYSLPLENGQSIKKFDLSIRVANCEVVLKGFLNSLKKLVYSNEKGYRVIKYSDKKFKADKTLEFEIPKYKDNDYAVYTGEHEGETYFYVTMKAPELQDTRKKAPSSVAVFWDVSNSGYRRNLSEELTFLREYLKMLPATTRLSVSGFSNGINYYKEFNDSKSGQEILDYIKTFSYDGGTNLNNLELPDDYDEIILFSDGINTIGEESALESSRPVYTVSSAAGSNYTFLHKTAEAFDGEFLNLSRFGIVYCLKKITTVRRKSLSYKINSGDVYSIYPRIKTTIDKHFEFSGIISSDEAEIEVDFGSSNGEKETRSIKIKPENNVPVHRIWATKKMHYLERDYDANKDEILNLGREHTIVTRNTSLIVLKDSWDYRKHGIMPPPELVTRSNKEWYETKEKEEDQDNDLEKDNHKTLKRLIKWYYPYRGNENLFASAIGESREKISSLKQGITSKTMGENTSVYSGGSIEGIIFDETGYAVSGAVIIVSQNGEVLRYGTSGTKGNYSIESLNTGVYNIDIKRLGYNDVNMRNVSISGDKITVIHQKLNSSPLMGEPIFVRGKKPQPLTALTGSSMRVKNETVTESYSIGSIDDLLASSAGSIEYSNGFGSSYEPYNTSGDIKSIDDLLRDSAYDVTIGGESHARGGRGAETKIMINGMLQSEDVDGGQALGVVPSGSYRNPYGYQTYDASDDSDNIDKALNAQSEEMNVSNENRKKTSGFVIDIENLEKVDFSSGNLYITKDNDELLKNMKYDYQRKKYLSSRAAGLKLISWNQDSVYTQRLLAAEPDSLGRIYFNFKKDNMNNPFFYYNSSMVFEQRGLPDAARRILTNMVEIDLENAELIRLVARQLLSIKDYDGALALFDEVRELRPEEPQSFRDLALACQEAGYYQQALNLFMHIINNKWKDEKDIKTIVLNEMNNLIFLHNDKISIKGIDPIFINYMPLDVRIVLEWSCKDADVDLIVIEPGDEKCCFSNRYTKSGGKMTSDMSRGYGPEEYTIRYAPKGKFRVKVRNLTEKKYLEKSAIVGYASIYTKYGTNDQTVQKLTFELKEQGELLMLGTINP